MFLPKVVGSITSCLESVPLTITKLKPFYCICTNIYAQIYMRYEYRFCLKIIITKFTELACTYSNIVSNILGFVCYNEISNVVCVSGVININIQK